MRKFSITLSVLVLLAMLLTACGGQQTGANVPATNVPPVTVESTSTNATTGSAANAFVLQADPNVLQNAPTTDLTSVLPAIGQAAGTWDADIQNYWLSGGSTSTTGTST